MIPFTADFPGYVKDPDLGDKIHCVAFVIDGSTIDKMSDKVYKEMKDLRIKVNHRGNFGKIIVHINKKIRLDSRFFHLNNLLMNKVYKSSLNIATHAFYAYLKCC